MSAVLSNQIKNLGLYHKIFPQNNLSHYGSKPLMDAKNLFLNKIIAFLKQIYRIGFELRRRMLTKTAALVHGSG